MCSEGEKKKEEGKATGECSPRTFIVKVPKLGPLPVSNIRKTMKKFRT